MRVRRETKHGRVLLCCVAGGVFSAYWTITSFAQTADSGTGAGYSPATVQGQVGEPPPSTLTGEWGGRRTELRDMGIEVNANFKAEFAALVQGGTQTGSAEAGQLAVGTTIDTQKLWGLAGGTFQTTITYRQGSPLADEFGVPLLQEVQEVYGRGDIARLTEFWYQQKLANGTVVFKIGRMPEGDFNSFPCNFMNLALCGAPGGNIVSNYWLNWPTSEWAGWIRVNTGDFDTMVGAYETNPKDLDESFSPGWFSGAEGVLTHLEEGWSPKFGSDQLQGRYQIGAWYDTVGGSDVLLGSNGEPAALTGLPALQTSDRYGFYVQGLQQLTGKGVALPGGWKGIDGLTFFFNYIQADRATAVLNSQASVGIFYAAPFASRQYDHFGVGLARTNYNARAAEAIMLAHPGFAVPRAEYSTEIYYSYLLFPWLTLRPDVQYIIDPGGYSHRDSAIVIGARTVMNF
jgi:porin